MMENNKTANTFWTTTTTTISRIWNRKEFILCVCVCVFLTKFWGGVLSMDTYGRFTVHKHHLYIQHLSWFIHECLYVCVCVCGFYTIFKYFSYCQCLCLCNCNKFSSVIIIIIWMNEWMNEESAIDFSCSFSSFFFDEDFPWKQPSTTSTTTSDVYIWKKKNSSLDSSG